MKFCKDNISTAFLYCRPLRMTLRIPAVAGLTPVAVVMPSASPSRGGHQAAKRLSPLFCLLFWIGAGFSAVVLGSQAIDAAVRPIPVDQRETQDSAASPSQVLTDRSRVYVFVGKTGFGHDHAIEGRLKSGSLILGAGSGAGELVFDMQSFDADTNASRRYIGLPGTTDQSTRRQVNENMKGPEVLDVRRFPEATFRIDSALLLEQKSREGHDQYQLAGRFTLHGVTRPLRIQIEVRQQNQELQIRGVFSILQTAYGMVPFRKALGAVGVTDQLKIYGDLRMKSDGGV